MRATCRVLRFSGYDCQPKRGATIANVLQHGTAFGSRRSAAARVFWTHQLKHRKGLSGKGRSAMARRAAGRMLEWQ